MDQFHRGLKVYVVIRFRKFQDLELFASGLVFEMVKTVNLEFVFLFFLFLSVFKMCTENRITVMGFLNSSHFIK